MSIQRSLRLLPAPKDDFIGLTGKVHLSTGGEPPLLKVHRQAFERFAADKASGYDGYWRHWEEDDALRGDLARLMQAEPGDIGMVGNASEAIMRIVASIDWRPGDNVVVPELDYASGRFALGGLKARGVEVRLVPGRGWWIAREDIVAACDNRTRLVYLSQVNALTGQHHDIAALSRALEGSGAALMVDASHALGVVPVDARLCDFVVSCCYKFLLGIHDGVLVWNRRRRPDFIPSGAGWASATAGASPADYHLKPDARRVEFGNAGHLGAYLLRDSLAYLESFGIDAIAAHTRALAGRFIAGMGALGLEVMTPAAPENHAGNAAFVCTDPQGLTRKAAAEDIFVWGDNGRLRVTAHLFATEEDVETFLDRLPRYLA
ncbi:aminotransferase class V-fold PLP-dependent enzyme [Pelagibius litoralis]|uniref:Aminotransferase class V-fold PLP-dependent enzyme n=1 Tax=Pelagibius litoralis TaxID=374515 RepID=A0A967EX71_9PROT|nr:aminotransferase class V-fold PLP-dependent enzyme [Pelagibius litoralis]NIA68030.1 aminotransferase class V-fold PLP-dependent enzyme [Pelagibius litoralis]